MSQQKGRRRGENFCLRLAATERAELERMQRGTLGPAGLGPWLVWAARLAFLDGVLPRAARPGARGNARARALRNAPPAPLGNARSSDVGNAPTSSARNAGALTDRNAVAWVGGNARAIAKRSAPPLSERIVLDLCSGSGSWSEPYKRAGYDVRRVTLPEFDVRIYQPPERGVWGILAAPPCTEFSLARNGSAKGRDFFAGLEVVAACLRVVVTARPRWWALENPIGMLSHWLGAPVDTWEPYEFGDPWSKATAIWGEFSRPERGPFVKPKASAARRSTPAARAVTPPGFARAFFNANP